MEKKLIEFKNTTNEDIRILHYLDGSLKELLLVFEYDKNNTKDYILLGKVSGKSSNVTGSNLIEWLVTTRKLINKYKNYKEIKTENSYEFEKFLNLKLTNDMLFTREGYDLITNKFIYTNFEINRTVEMKINHRDNKIFYEPAWLRDNNDKFNKENFFDIIDLEDNYYFTDFELKNISLNKFIKYMVVNSEKISKLLIDKSIKDNYNSLTNSQSKIKFLKQLILIKNSNLCHKKNIDINDYKKTF